jgi:hypothetical protein
VNATALTTRDNSASCPPAVITREFDRLVGRMSNAIEQTPGGALEVSERYAPKPHERDAVMDRIGQLDRALYRADGGRERTAAEDDALRVKTMLAALLGGMSTMGASADAAKLKVGLCVSALRPFPMWVIERACALIRDGETGSVLGGKDLGIRRGYPPEAPQLAELCRHIVAPVQQERASLHRLLSAKVYKEPTEEDLARRDEVIAAGLAKIKRSNDMRAPEWDRQAKEREFRKSEAGEPSIPAMSLSPDLAAKVAEKQREA